MVYADHVYQFDRPVLIADNYICWEETVGCVSVLAFLVTVAACVCWLIIFAL